MSELEEAGNINNVIKLIVFRGITPPLAWLYNQYMQEQ